MRKSSTKAFFTTACHTISFSSTNRMPILAQTTLWTKPANLVLKPFGSSCSWSAVRYIGIGPVAPAVAVVVVPALEEVVDWFLPACGCRRLVNTKVSFSLTCCSFSPCSTCFWIILSLAIAFAWALPLLSSLILLLLLALLEVEL